MLFYPRLKARSSGGERFLDTEEVGGSRPPGPTIKNQGVRLIVQDCHSMGGG
jgi:hypothetical protein